jgi:hypothetical protein
MSINSNAQTIYQKLEDIEDKLDEMEFERDMREIRRRQDMEFDRYLREQNLKGTYNSPNKSTNSREISSNPNEKICYVIWNGENFSRLRNKQSNMFFIHIVDNEKKPFIEIYLPKSYENNKSKLNKFIKSHIEEIKRVCQ